MDFLLLIFLDVLLFFGFHLIPLAFYGIGMISETPKSVMRWYIAGTLLDGFSAFGLLTLIQRSQAGVPTKENLLSLIGSVVICTAFYFIMRRKANRLRNSATAIPASRYQTQESEMGKFVVDSETGEVIREDPPDPKPSNTNSAREPAVGTKPVRPEEPPVIRPAQPPEPVALKGRRYKAAVIALSAVCAVLAVSVFLLEYSANSTRAEHQQLMESVETLTAENAELQETVSELESQNKKGQEKITSLEAENTNLERDLKSSRIAGTDMFSSLYHIGFIVNGSPYYHLFTCGVYTSADEYWAHNIEYCEYLGYSKCPDCW